MSIKTVIISLCVWILIFVLGLGIGILYQSQKNVPQVQVQGQDQKVADAVSALNAKVASLKSLTSPVILSISAYGKITNINGRNVTITRGKDAMVLALKSDANISSVAFAAPGPLPSGSKKPASPAPTPTVKQLSLQDLKVGNDVTARVRVLASGQIEGLSVTVLAPTATK